MRKHLLKGRLLPACLVLILLVQLASCQLNSLIRGDLPPQSTPIGGTNQPSDNMSNNNENEGSSSNEGEKPSDSLFFSPLSGLPTTEKTMNTRPLLFVYGNSEAAAPQYGLSRAELIFEVPVEDGSTRLLAAFTDYEELQKIGGLRSASPYYSDLAAFFNAILIHSGNLDGSASSEPLGVDTLSAAVHTSGFYKESDRVSPHNLFTTPTRLLNAMRIAGYSVNVTEASPFFRFLRDGNALSLSGTAATHIRIDYSETHRTEFRYQSASGVYKRYQNGIVQTDAENGAALTARNVFILYCNSTLTENADGKQLSLSIDSGTGIYLSDGAYIPILWYKNSEGGLIFIRESDGAILAQNAGTSYIELVKSSEASDVILDCN